MNNAQNGDNEDIADGKLCNWSRSYKNSVSYSAADFYLVVPHKIKINRGSHLFSGYANKLQS